MRCSHCGATLGRDAAWCGMCLAAVAPPAGPPGAAAPYPPPGYAPAPPPGYAPAPPPGYAPVPPPGYAAVPAAPQPGAAPYPVPGQPGTPYAAVATTQHWTQPAPGYAGPAGVSYDRFGVPSRPAARLEPMPPPRAGWTTFAAIGVGALVHTVLWLLLRDATIENEAAIRYSIVATLTVYGIVTYLVVSRIQSDGHPLRWHGSWPWQASAAFGAGVGAAFAWTLMQISKAAGAEGGGDPSIAILVSEGDFVHIGAAFLIVCVAAPVVEELLFRGLLLMSLLRRTTRFAIWVSAVAFAAWHLAPSALKYYSLAGALLGYLFLKQGLACSIGAHAAFNGTLLAAAVAFALSPGAVIANGDITMRAPKGWHTTDQTPMGYFYGPSGGEVLLMELGGTYADLDPEELVARVQLGVLPELSELDVRGDTARTVELPAGTAVRAAITHEGRDGEVVLLPTKERLYFIVLSSGGSPRVRDDFDTMLQTVELTPSG